MRSKRDAEKYPRIVDEHFVEAEGLTTTFRRALGELSERR